MSGRCRVGVVGFGVAGATAAYLLAKAGHQVSLFERAPAVGPVGAGILLQPSGQIVLERLGLLDRLKTVAEPIEELHAVTHTGRTIIRMPYGELGREYRAYGVHRGDLFTLLHEAVESQAVDIFLGHEITSRRETDQSAFLTDADGREHGPFHFVIAADGARSALRAASQQVRWSHDYRHAALWAIGQTNAVSRKLHQVVRGTHSLLGLLPMGGGRCSLFWGLRRDHKESLWDKGFAAWRASVIDLCPLADGIFDSVTSFEQTRFTTYQHAWLKQPHEGRTLFLGDAAHAMSPHLGQGLNFALVDAYCLGRLMESSDDCSSAFRVFQRMRRSQTRYYSLITLMLTPFFQSDGVIKGFGRDLALPIISRLPWVRGQMLLTMAGLKGGFLRGKITLD
jgi:2-polyprenyl-6-methoxyphenol hydroxylase-like FAD-dependent oxidoreductase